MATLIRLTEAGNGNTLLINADAVTCILPARTGAGATIFFVSSDDDKVDVRETLDQIEAALGAVTS